MIKPLLSKLKYFLYIIIFLSIWFFLFWKCRYGLANWDEAFYLTIPYRICLGDRLLLHEWHLSQTSGLLLVPLVKLYLAIFHSTAGICLRFRWVFTVVWGLTSLFLFYRLKIFSQIGAMLASLAFFIYTPFGIMALSYNTMGILFVLLSCVVIATARRCINFQHFVSGILFSYAVLCCPYLLILFLAFCLLALVKRNPILRQCWLFFTMGAGTVFLLFCVVLLRSATLQEYISVLPALFNDPEHPSLHLPTKILILLTATWEINWLTFPAVLITIVLSYICAKKKWMLQGFVIVSLLSLLLLRTYWFINHYMFPLSLLGFYCAIVRKDDSAIRILFQTVWIPGLIYAFCLHLSSNQNFQAFTSASVVMLTASLVMALRFLRVCLSEVSSKKLSVIALCLIVTVVASQFYFELKSRYSTVYWEAGMSNQTEQATEGPEKGIFMNPDIYEYYQISERDVSFLSSNSNVRSVLFLSPNNWLYLSAQKEFSTYSAWLSKVDELAIARLDQYYTLFPEKIPDAVFFDRDNIRFIPHFEEMGFFVSNYDTSEYAVILLRNELKSVA